MRNFLFLILGFTTLSYCTPKESSSVLSEDQTSGVVQLNQDGTVFLTYLLNRQCPGTDTSSYYCRSGFIHPLVSPSGKVVTDDFPTGHTHQHGLFFAWTHSRFRGDTLDFWNQQKEQASIRYEELIEQHENGFTSRQRHYSLKHGDILEETWKVETVPSNSYRIIDLDVSQTNITTDTFFILPYHYGGLGVRASKHWNKEDEAYQDSARVLTSEGLNRQASNHTRPKWTAMYGPIDDASAGIAVLDHPDNDRFPQPIRVHPTMPYFCLAPSVLGAWNIPPGDTIHFRYRIVVFDGEADASALNQLSEEYQTASTEM